MIKAIIFDLFGTLTDSYSNHEQRIIDYFNLDVSMNFVEEVTNGIKFENMDSYLKIIIKKLNLKDTEETREKLVEIFKEEKAKEKINKEAESVLKELKSRNFRLGIISNIPNPDWDLLEENNLKKYFDYIFYSFRMKIR